MNPARAMPDDEPRQAAALIDHILTRFHDTHRRELPELLLAAGALEAHGAAPGITGALQALGEALERHMFKEEMRLFPMMAQGGNTLIRHLIEDMEAEHREHAGTLSRLRVQLHGLQVPRAGAAALHRLRLAFDKLDGDLAEHIRVEDGLLFPLFLPR